MPYKNRVAVLGAGLTRFMRRALETPKELAFEASKAALEDAGLGIEDIDCVITVTAPDAFDGVHMNGEYLADGAGGRGKPYMRSYVGGRLRGHVPHNRLVPHRQRPVPYLPGGGRGEDVLGPAPCPGRLQRHL